MLWLSFPISKPSLESPSRLCNLPSGQCASIRTRPIGIIGTWASPNLPMASMMTRSKPCAGRKPIEPFHGGFLPQPLRLWAAFQRPAKKQSSFFRPVPIGGSANGWKASHSRTRMMHKPGLMPTALQGCRIDHHPPPSRHPCTRRCGLWNVFGREELPLTECPFLAQSRRHEPTWPASAFVPKLTSNWSNENGIELVFSSAGQKTGSSAHSNFMFKVAKYRPCLC